MMDPAHIAVIQLIYIMCYEIREDILNHEPYKTILRTNIDISQTEKIIGGLSHQQAIDIPTRTYSVVLDILDPKYRPLAESAYQEMLMMTV